MKRMITIKHLETENITLEITIRTTDLKSHAVVTRFSKDYTDILDQTFLYMKGLIRALEFEYRENIKRVGK